MKNPEAELTLANCDVFTSNACIVSKPESGASGRMAARCPTTNGACGIKFRLSQIAAVFDRTEPNHFVTASVYGLSRAGNEVTGLRQVLWKRKTL